MNPFRSSILLLPVVIRSLTFGLVVFVSAILVAQEAGKANESTKPPNSQSADDAQEPVPQISAQRRNELLVFVNAHHAELRPLLNSLRRTRPKDYQAALTQLDREVKQLQVLEKRAQERYQISLAQWVVKSKIKLVAAQLSINKTPREKAKLVAELSRLTTQQQDLKVDLAVYDLMQASKRVERLATNLHELQSNRTAEIERQQKNIQKNAQRVLNARKKSEQPKQKSPETNSKPDPKKPKKQDENAQSKEP